MKYLTYVLTFVLIFNLAGAQVVLGQKSDEKRVATVKEKVERLGGNGKSTIVVKMLDGRIFKGKVTNRTADQFTIREKNDIESNILFTDVKSIHRPGLSAGAKTAVIASVAAGGVVILVFLGSYLCWGGRC